MKVEVLEQWWKGADAPWTVRREALCKVRSSVPWGCILTIREIPGSSVGRDDSLVSQGTCGTPGCGQVGTWSVGYG